MGLVRRKNDDAHEVHSELKLVIIQSCCLSDGRRRVDDTDLKSAFLDKTRTCTYTDTYADTVAISDTITVKVHLQDTPKNALCESPYASQPASPLASQPAS